MALQYIEVRALRNLTSVQLSPSPALTLLFGANGSGKTSVLEAVHLAGMGRSFRTQHSKQLVQVGQTAAVVYTRVQNENGVYGVGVQKQIDDATQIKVNGERADSAAVLAQILPLQLLTPESHNLLQGEPRERRAYLDWGLFHVEHGFIEVWKRYRRNLDQRNAALRSGKPLRELRQWEIGLAQYGEQIAALRADYLEQLRPLFEQLYVLLVDDVPPRLVLRQGWNREFALAEALDRNRSSEQNLGYTLAGPHRADMKLLSANGMDAADTFSRGQQKLALCALRLAQMQHLQQFTGRRCTLLMDDLPAELDADRRRMLLKAALDSQAQCFVTATDEQLIDVSSVRTARVFHVEHGAVAEVI